MIKDQEKTTFVAVCIAEFLSISETERLLEQLRTQEVRSSHVVVNQLVLGSPTEEEIASLDGVSGRGRGGGRGEIW
jgi:arsenite-transporting ATPase